MRFDERIYGPGATKSSRVLLAVPGREYPDEIAKAIVEQAEAGAQRSAAPPAEPGPDGLVPMSGGRYELPNGEIVKGKQKALDALAELKATEAGGTGDGTNTEEV